MQYIYIYIYLWSCVGSSTLQASEAKMLLLLVGRKQCGRRNKAGRDWSFDEALHSCKLG